MGTYNKIDYTIDPAIQAKVTEAANLASLVGNYFLPATVGTVTAEKPSNPVYDKATATLGVLKQVDKVMDTFLLAKQGIHDLREHFDASPLDKEKSLLKRVGAYLDQYLIPAERSELLSGFYADGKTFRLPAINSGKEIPRPGDKTGTQVEKRDANGAVVVENGKAVMVDLTHNEQSALFTTGRFMVDEIRTLEALRQALTVIRRRRQLALTQQQNQLLSLQQQIPEAYKQLDLLDGQRQAALGDQAVAKRLLAEHWAEVEQAWAQRRKVLENHQGVYYARVRETPLSLSLPDPLDLRYTDADDIVPGCGGEITAIPAALTPFLEAVYDLPVGDWAALHDLYPLLPDRARLQSLVDLRRNRLDQKPVAASDGSALAMRLLPLQQQNLGMNQLLMQRPFSIVGALSLVQQQGRDLLSLDDLLTGPSHRLRAPAAGLHQRLGNAAACLVEQLRGIAPSIRLDWAAAAENDRLPVEQPELWPSLDKAEDADFNRVRTLVELVHWWFRQLHADAHGASRTALRNYLRASLLWVASDDPGQILHGTVSTLPGRFLPGHSLRLKLNREALAGSLLSLMDSAQNVVGTVRVDDHDEQGAIAVITQVLDVTATLSTAFLVRGKSV